MEFLGLGPVELIIVLVVALLVFGPDKVVEIARTLGRLSRRISQAGKDFTRALEEEARPMTDAAKEVNNSLKTEALAVGKAGKDFARDLQEAKASTPTQKGQEAPEHDQQHH